MLARERVFGFSWRPFCAGSTCHFAVLPSNHAHALTPHLVRACVTVDVVASEVKDKVAADALLRTIEDGAAREGLDGGQIVALVRLATSAGTGSPARTRGFPPCGHAAAGLMH